MRYDFRTTPLTNPPFAVFQARLNLVQDERGLHLWCRGGAGAGVMLKQANTYGTWRVRSRISTQGRIPTTKVCELLWPAGTGWPPEIDFNESGDRSRANQTMHYTEANLMHHTGYSVDQTTWHTYGVQVEEQTVSYFCDEVLRAAVPNEAPGTPWSLHLRTQPNLDTESETVLDVRWIEVPE